MMVPVFTAPNMCMHTNSEAKSPWQKTAACLKYSACNVEGNSSKVLSPSSTCTRLPRRTSPLARSECTVSTDICTVVTMVVSTCKLLKQKWLHKQVQTCPSARMRLKTLSASWFANTSSYLLQTYKLSAAMLLSSRIAWQRITYR